MRLHSDWGRRSRILRVQRRPACECSKPQTHGFKLPESCFGSKAAVVNVRLKDVVSKIYVVSGGMNSGQFL